MAVDIFLCCSNNIKGESKDNTFKDQIDILSWSWGCSNSGTMHMGGGGGGGKMNAQDLGIVKYVDLSSNDLIKRCCNGDHIEWAELIVRKAGGQAPLPYFAIRMEEVMVTSYQTGSGMGDLDRIQEQLSLNFAKFTITYKLQDEKGALKGKTDAGWDIGANSKHNSPATKA